MTMPESTPVQEPVSVELVSESTPPAVKLVAIILGAALILSLVAITYLAATEHTAPDVLQNVAVGSLAALSALLVGNRR
jgi:hypothetical protein